MKSFFRENPTIAFGLGLPLILVVVFLLISGLPTLLVSPPQYEVLYASEYYNYQNDIQISVVGEKVQVVYQGGAYNNRKPKIWRYNPKTGAVKEIAYLLPPNIASGNSSSTDPNQVSEIIAIKVPDLEGVKVDSSSIAPDGYEFRLGRNRYSGNMFDGLFYSSRYRHEAVLSKNGRNVRLPHPHGQYYSTNTHFIGWVLLK